MLAQGFQCDQPTQAVADQGGFSIAVSQLRCQMRDGGFRRTENAGIAEDFSLKPGGAQAPSQRQQPDAQVPDTVEQQYPGTRHVHGARRRDRWFLQFKDSENQPASDCKQGAEFAGHAHRHFPQVRPGGKIGGFMGIAHDPPRRRWPVGDQRLPVPASARTSRYQS